MMMMIIISYANASPTVNPDERTRYAYMQVPDGFTGY